MLLKFWIKQPQIDVLGFKSKVYWTKSPKDYKAQSSLIESVIWNLDDWLAGEVWIFDREK